MRNCAELSYWFRTDSASQLRALQINPKHIIPRNKGHSQQAHRCKLELLYTTSEFALFLSIPYYLSSDPIASPYTDFMAL